MKNIFLLIVIGLTFGVCGYIIHGINSGVDNSIRSSNTTNNIKYTCCCVDGVEYIQFRTNQLAPHFKPDGTLYTCE